MNIPTDKELTLTTFRLILEPTKANHSEETIKLFQDTDLYKYIPFNPQQDLEELRKVYLKREAKVSPDKSEIWLNWIARNKESKEIIGEFQATLHDNTATIAYMIDKSHQSKGYAFEALKEILKYLKDKLNIIEVRAYIDTRNLASINLIEKLMFEKIETNENADEFKGAKSHEYVYSLK